MPAGPIVHPPKKDSKRLRQEERKARLAAELRANLLKRKAQGRARARQDASATGPDAVGQGQQPQAREATDAHTREPTGEVA